MVSIPDWQSGSQFATNSRSWRELPGDDRFILRIAACDRHSYRHWPFQSLSQGFQFCVQVFRRIDSLWVLANNGARHCLTQLRRNIAKKTQAPVRSRFGCPAATSSASAGGASSQPRKPRTSTVSTEEVTIANRAGERRPIMREAYSVAVL